MGDVTVEAFVKRLARAEDSLGPGGVAALRRGVGRPVGMPPAAASAFFSLVPPAARDLERASWVVATLWARHAQHVKGYGSFGHSLRGLAARQEAAALRLLTRLLGADTDELPAALRRAIGLLRDKAIPVDYEQLVWDIREREWDKPDRDVQRRWARDFHRPHADGGGAPVDAIEKGKG